MPAIAAAPLRNTSRAMLLRPEMSQTAFSIAMSFRPTKGAVKPEASVEIISLGRP